jgi:DNA-binding CsgD family transcriptional regulator
LSDKNPKVANSQDFIKSRRERILALMAQGATKSEIAATLSTTKVTVDRDLRNINNQTNKEYSRMVRESIPTLFDNCLTSLNSVLKNCWLLHAVDDPQRVTTWHKINILRLIAETTEKKFNMISNGPALMEVNRLKQRLEELKNGIQLTP